MTIDEIAGQYGVTREQVKAVNDFARSPGQQRSALMVTRATPGNYAGVERPFR